MNIDGIVMELEITRKFFLTGIGCFEEADSSFKPKPEMFSVAAQVEHTALTVEWFIEGAFGEGWDMDFESHTTRCGAATSLDAAKAHFSAAIDKAIETIRGATPEQLMEEIPDKAIMAGAPRIAVVNGIVDHTAHHRGSLAVYARMMDKVPPMPYA